MGTRSSLPPRGGGLGWGANENHSHKTEILPRLAVDGGCDMIHHCEIISPFKAGVTCAES